MRHFAEHLHESTYDSKITEASIPLETESENLVSIKIRPVRNNGKDEYENAGASGWDYEDFRKYFNENKSDFKDIQSDHFSALFTTKNGEKFLYVEHETGPELIYDLAYKTIDFIGTIGGFILLILEIIKRNDDKHFKDVHGKNRIEAITIEERKKGKKVKVKKIVRIEGIDKIDLNKKQIKELLKKLK